MKRKNEKEIKINEQKSALENYKKKQDKFIDEIHNNFINETLLHCDYYRKARARVEETLDEKQESLFHFFTIVALEEGRGRERMLIKFVLDYIFQKIMKDVKQNLKHKNERDVL